jgi:hypothetical protein
MKRQTGNKKLSIIIIINYFLKLINRSKRDKRDLGMLPEVLFCRRVVPLLHLGRETRREK